MRQFKLILIVAIAIAWSPINATDAVAKGFKGGGGGARSGGGGGGARHASMPNLGSGGGSRPSPAQRPSASRPSASRPSASRPSASRPSTSRPGISQPSPGRPNIGRPGSPQPDRPSLGGSISGGLKPSTRPQQRPSTLPSKRPSLPSTLPGNKPNLPGNRPDRPGNRPDLPGNRPNLPGNKPNLPTTLPSNRPNRPSLPNLGGGGGPNRFPGNQDRPSAGDLGDFLGIGGGVRPGTMPGQLPNKPDLANRPNRPGNTRPGDRLPGNDRPGINRPGNDRPGNNRPGDGRPIVNRPNNRPNNRPINIGNLNVGNTVINNRPSWSTINRNSVNQIENRWGNQIGGLHGWASAHPARVNHWHSWGNDVRFRWNGYHHHNNWFAGNWWYSHPSGLCRWHYYHSFNRHPWNYWWQRPPTWAAATGWFTWSAPPSVWSQPIYYDYGSGGNVVYENNYVYINGEQVATADDFADSAAALATVTPPTSDVTADGGDEAAVDDAAENDEWMPLGTFALSTNEDDVEPTRIVQLAVDKSGIISGTLYNRETDQADAIQGRVDKNTQRVAMRLGSTDEIVAETGLYNLTQNETPLLVHFGKDRTENYVLVRLEEAEGAGEARASDEAEGDVYDDISN